MTTEFQTSVLLFTLTIINLCVAHKEDTRKEIVIPKDEKVLLLLGGVADRQVKGRTVNTLNLAELIFPNGDHCYPDQLVLPQGLGAGFALSNRKDRIVSCFGFKDGLPFYGCLMWRKVKDRWSLPKDAPFSGKTTTIDKLYEYYKEDPENVLFPTWTPCKDHECVYFYLNTAKYASPLMLAKMNADDQVSIQTISRRKSGPARSCLVLADNYLIQLGGVKEQFDYLNMGAEVDNAKILLLDEKGNARSGWMESRCPISYIGYMQACIRIKGEGNSSKILTIGGELQVKRDNSDRDDDDDIFDVADVRILSFYGKGKHVKLTDEKGDFKCERKKVTIPKGSFQGLLKDGRKDMAWGFMQNSTGTFLAMGIGGRNGTGVQSTARAGIVIAKVDNRSSQLLKNPDNGILHTELIIPRYATNFVTVLSNMFVGGNCSVRKIHNDDESGQGGKLVVLNFSLLLALTLIYVINTLFKI